MAHNDFCYEPRGACYFLTCTCPCHGEAVSRARLRFRTGVEPPPPRRDLTCWGFEAGGTANGICNLIWLALLLGAVIFAIVSLA